MILVTEIFFALFLVFLPHKFGVGGVEAELEGLKEVNGVGLEFSASS